MPWSSVATISAKESAETDDGAPACLGG
eukprot:SAG11_NODE_24840_length_367_cov_0.970149_1_plen_27_part_01